MRLLLVKQTYFYQPGNPVSYEDFFASVLKNLSPFFEIQVAEKADEAEKIIAEDTGKKISAALFLSQAMMAKAIKLGQKFPQLKFLVFGGNLENDFQRLDNTYLIKKDASRIESHFQKAREVIISD
ncbi:MAG: hypothetical protein PHE24_06755 [Patescibacteria group bacterium]|nr:hypothetical protein [Patescibacteria group bacterium]